MLYPPATLLIVDDEPSIRESLSLVLTEIGYSVRSAEDGFSALREIVNEAPDCCSPISICPVSPVSSCSPRFGAVFPPSGRLP